ncbi:UNVERIFIED_CONTAM: hypothetical protein ITH22_24880 [Salmonella enterica subsp. enterica serovar Weltevreden]
MLEDGFQKGKKPYQSLEFLETESWMLCKRRDDSYVSIPVMVASGEQSFSKLKSEMIAVHLQYSIT